ncbi:MAG TPA: SDR family NAD(P)-dependent oxidoreductase, partial [Streptomyces sp.]|nr:SDR family NAD(P)-dependent oxidoreductase [Streptomyces sp.]
DAGQRPAGSEDGGATAGPVVLPVSASTPDSCLATATALADALRGPAGPALPDAAHTLAHGREAKPYRLAVVADDRDSAARGLEGDPARAVEGWANTPGTPLVLMPGQGADLSPLTRALWGWEPVFSSVLEDLWAHVRQQDAAPTVGQVLGDPSQLSLPQQHAWHTAQLLSLAAQLEARGLPRPVFAGYSLGEFAAAAAAGAHGPKECLSLVLERGRALRGAPAGAMIAVRIGAEEAAELLPGSEPAALLSADRRVFAVAAAELDAFRARLDEAGVPYRETGVDLPYHCSLLDDAAAAFDAAAQCVAAPVTDRWIPTATGAAPDAPDYWQRHLTGPVDFTVVAASAADLADKSGCTLVDLSTDGFLGRAVAQGLGGASAPVVNPFRGADDPRTGYLRALAGLWTAGFDMDLSTPAAAGGGMVPLPSRVFDLRRHAKPRRSGHQEVEVAGGRRTVRRERSLERWAYHPSWRMKRRSPLGEDVSGQRWLVFADRDAHSAELLGRLRDRGVDCVPLYPAGATASGSGVVPGDEHAVKSAIRALDPGSRPLHRVVHLWCGSEVTDPGTLDGRLEVLGTELARGFYTLLYAIQEITALQGAVPLHLDVVGRGMHPLAQDGGAVVPERALLSGPALVIPQDMPFVTARSVDPSGLEPRRAVDELVAELVSASDDRTVTFGQGGRWVRAYERDVLPPVEEGRLPMRLRERGVYLITGGLGGIGMTLAEYLVKTCRARLVLTGLESVPEPGILQGQVETDDPALQERIARIRKLEELGGEVLAVRCDAADRAETEALFAQIDRRFGRLDGVVHAAGVFETQRAFRSLDDTGREDCERRLRPKVEGTLMLAEFLRGRRLDFVLMQSSLSSHLGGLGFYAYTAGNAF